VPKTPQGAAAPLAGQETPSLGRTALLFWLQAGLTAVMRIAWVWPWLLGLQTWLSPSAQGPLLPLGALPALLLGGRLLVQQAAERGVAARQARAGIALLGLLVVLGLLWAEYGAPLAPWDLRWLQLATGEGSLWANEIPPAVLAFVAAAGLWLRGILDGGRADDHAAVAGAWKTGAVAFVLLLLAGQLSGDLSAAAGSQGWLLLFVVAGMAALALAGMERALYSGSMAHTAPLRPSRSWLASVGTVIGAVVLLGLLLSAWLAPGQIAQWLALLEPVVDLLAWLLLALLYGAVYALFWALTPLIDWLRTMLANAQPAEMALEAAPLQPLSPLLQEQLAGEVVAAATEPLRWGAIGVVLVVTAVLFALSLRLLRGSAVPDGEETRESILTRSLLGEQLRALWEQLRRPAVSTVKTFLPLDSEPALRREVRSRYQTFLAAMAAQGQRRPPSATPACYAAALDQLTPPQQAALQQLTDLYVAVRYGALWPEAEQLPAASAGWDSADAG